MGARGVEDGPAVVEALGGDGADGGDGGAEALSQVYDRWSALVYSLALRSLGEVARAEEVTKRVFTDVWTSRGTFDPARSSFSAWLIDLTCARIDEADRASRPAPVASPGRESAEDSPGRESRPVALAERLVLADGLSHLDAVPQRVLRMVLDDLSPAEVAERTGLSVADVKSQIASSLIQLRQRWEVPTDAH